MTEEELIQLYYRDGLDADAIADLERRLASDASLAARFAALSADLDAISAAAPEAAPEAARERWHATVHTEAARAPRGGRHAGRLALLASSWPLALAATLVVGVGIGVFIGLRIDEAAPPGAPVVAAAIDNARRTAMERGFAQHLRTSRARLAALASDAQLDRTTVIASLIDQNRLQQRAARSAEAHDLLRLLRAFELLLLQLEADAETNELDRLRARLDFEYQTTLQYLDRSPLGGSVARTPITL